jgi:hypothetical protein
MITLIIILTIITLITSITLIIIIIIIIIMIIITINIMIIIIIIISSIIIITMIIIMIMIIIIIIIVNAIIITTLQAPCALQAPRALEASSAVRSSSALRSSLRVRCKVALVQSAMDAKRRRIDTSVLQELVHTGGVSQCSLAAILKTLHEKELLEAEVNTQELQRASAKKYSHLLCEEPLRMKNGTTWQWKIADASLLVSEFVSTVPNMSAVWNSAYEKAPFSTESPWHIILAYDEYAPGNKLSVDNRRKGYNISMTFRELGQAAITSDSCWFTIGCIRSSIVREAEGEFSQCLSVIISKLLVGEFGMLTKGTPVRVCGRDRLLFARLGNLSSDLDGIRSGLGWRGSSSFKPCAIHHNIFKKDSGLVQLQDPSSKFIEVTCLDRSKFLAHSKASLDKVVDTLTAAKPRLTRAKFEELEQMSGMSHIPCGLLQNISLRSHLDIPSCLTTDWAHNVLQDGTFPGECWHFLQSLSVTGKEVEDFLADKAWRFPCASQAKAKQLYRVFDLHRQKSSADAERIKGSMSELLAVFGMLRHFVELKLSAAAGSRSALAASFLALCKYIDTLLQAKRGALDIDTAAVNLATQLEEHGRLHVLAYGTQLLKPKHHWMLHIPQQLRRDRMVIDSFVLERLHLRIKRVAQNILNTSNYEQSVLTALLHVHARTPVLDQGLLQSAPYPGQPQILVGNGIVNGGQKVYAEDVVFSDHQCGQVACCFEELGRFYVLVEKMELVRNVVAHAALWKPSLQRALWRASAIQIATAWKREGTNVLVIRGS